MSKDSEASSRVHCITFAAEAGRGEKRVNMGRCTRDEDAKLGCYQFRFQTDICYILQ